MSTSAEEHYTTLVARLRVANPRTASALEKVLNDMLPDERIRALEQHLPTFETEAAGQAPVAAVVTVAACVPEPVSGTPGRPIHAFDAIFEHPALEAMDKLVYLYLWRRAGKKMVAWPKQVTIAVACRVSRSAVNRAVARLTKLDIVATKKGTFGGSTVYTLRPPDQWKGWGPIVSHRHNSGDPQLSPSAAQLCPRGTT